MVHKATEWQYLKQLEFDKNLNKSSFTFWTDKIRVVILMILVVVIWWIISLSQLPLESSPEVVLGIWVATVVMPWASPETMEDLVTKKLEKEIGKIKWIDTMNSTSMNWVSSVIVQFKAWENIKDSMRELKDQVDIAKKNLPEDAKEPVVKEISFSDQPFRIFSVAWNHNWLELRKYATKIKEELESIDWISEARISWWDEEEFEVAYDPKKLEQYWISMSDADQAIKNTNITIPIWNINIENYKHNITVDNRFYTANELSKIVVVNNWDTWNIYLKDIAKVSLKAKKRTSFARIGIEGKWSKDAITVSVIKKAGWSIVDLYKLWLEKVEKLKWKDIPDDIITSTTYSMAERIELDIESLTHDFLVTILLVLSVLFLFLWLKLSLVPTITIPIVFLFTFIFMHAFWLTLNFLSLFALVLSLWLLVDDAILIVEAFHKYSSTRKFSNREAMLLVLRDYKWVDTSTTFVIICFFASMMFMTWIMWKFLFSLPFVITIVLVWSLISSITIVPAIILLFEWRENKISEGEIQKKRGLKWFLSRIFNSKPLLSLNPLINIYEKHLVYILETKRRMWTFLVWIFVLFILAFSLPIVWLLKTEFFPTTDEDLMWIDIEWEPGQRLEITNEQTKKVEEILQEEKEIDTYTTVIWWWTAFANSWLGWWASWDNVAWITINLVKKELWRKEKSWDIAERLRNKVKKIEIPWLKVTVTEAKSWPPTWADLEIQVAWNDFKVLDRILDDLRNIIQEIPWALNITTSRWNVPFEYNIRFDSDRLALHHLTIPQVSMFLKESIDWVETTKVFKWTDEMVVKTRMEEKEVDTINKIKSLKIKNTRWQTVYIWDVINEEISKTVSSISRIDQKRVVTIRAWAAKTTNSQELLANFNKIVEKKGYKLPKWYEFIIWWTNEENAESMMSLWIAMMFWLVWVLIIMILQFNSYKESLISIIPIPLALIWVFFWLTLTWQTLSFPTLIWFVALFWMVSNHSIYLIDKINLNRENGVNFHDAIIDSCITRFEPVILTSLTTIMWFVPLALTTSVWASLAQALVFWLMTAWILKMFVVPVCYKLIIKS